MTTRTVVFDSPFLIGFENTRMIIERAAKADAETYPRYNVEQVNETTLRISLAVAGFRPNQLQVTVQDGQIVVIGRREADRAEAAPETYLHRGIAARGFQRTFVLADGMEVVGAMLEHGLLHIDVNRPQPKPEVTNIPIRMAG